MGKKERTTPIVHEDGFTVNGCTFTVDPKYQPIDVIGQGSYGVVCSVLNTHTNEKLAIKKITPMAGDEWDATHTLREIRLMRFLGTHENIIALKDLSMCQEKDELYMMMELADTDLHRLIQSACSLSDGHIRVIMYQLLSGVKAMHDNGVLHRDLKPGNLLLNKDCELKITDFGLARMIPKNQEGAKDDYGFDVSPMTEYVVTRWYRPPELMLAPSGCYDGAVDMWSVGCILGELITRKPIFPGKDFMDQLTRVFRLVPIPPPHERGYVIERDARKFISSLPETNPNAMLNLCKRSGPHTLDLMQKLLCFNPTQRISVDQALAHPFFDGIQEEWGDILPLELKQSLAFAFDTQSLPLYTLRSFICDEVLAFQQSSDDVHKDESKHEERSNTKEELMLTKPTASSSQLDSSGSDLSVECKEEDEIEIIRTEYDYSPGHGFAIKGCEFNVSSRYRPLQVLGEGSYGIVCSAKDILSGGKVAIKKLTPMAGDDWDAKHTLREIRLMRYFGSHPNIAGLRNLSTCVAKDELYITMDLIDTDLHRLIQSKTKLEDAHIAAIMYQLLSAVKALHENGVLHRDLKPGNVLVSRNCDVHVTDFGLSRYNPTLNTGRRRRSWKEDNEMDAKLHGGAMTEYVVTRWYRPPEIMLAPNGDYNDAVDMWSIGCIFGELLNRKPMFPGKDFMDQISRIFRVVELPPEGKRGYTVDDTAKGFLKSLPLCSPSSLRKTLTRASTDAVDLMKGLLCVSPQKRMTASQALAHPYFDLMRKQLGQPPDFSVGKAFDFEFDYKNLSLQQLKSLIKDEVTLLHEEEKRKEAAVEACVTLNEEKEDVCEGKSIARDSEDQMIEHHKPRAEEKESLSDELETKDRAVEDDMKSENSAASSSDLKEATNNSSKKDASKLSASSFDAILDAMAASHNKHLSSHEAQEIYFSNKDRQEQLNDHGSVPECNDGYDSDEIVEEIRRQAKARRALDTRKYQPTERKHELLSNNASDHDRWGHVPAQRDAIKHNVRSTSTRAQRHSQKGTTTNQTRPLTERYEPSRYSAPSAAPHRTTRSLSARTSTEHEELDSDEKSLPTGWVVKTHSKTGEKYYYDTLTKIATWRHPLGTRNHQTASQIPSRTRSTGVSSTLSSNQSSDSMETSAYNSHPVSHERIKSASSLPKDWVRRTDPKTGRLFYVNLLTKKSYATLPNHVTAAMLRLGKEDSTESLQSRHRLNTSRKKLTVPQSPHFSTMSWERKKRTGTNS